MYISFLLLNYDRFFIKNSSLEKQRDPRNCKKTRAQQMNVTHF